MYEFFSGGGCFRSNPSEGLAAEAVGMLWAVLRDFKAWGGVRTITALDNRFEQAIPGLNRNTLPADEVVPVTGSEHESVYLSLLKRCDSVLLIAPETDGVLSMLAEQAEAEGVRLLGCSSSAISAAGNKAVCSRLFELGKICTPETRTANFLTAERIAGQMRFPLVIKPLDGIGSEGVCRVETLSDLPAVLDIVRQATVQEQILLQTFAEGIHASVSLLIADSGCMPLSLNLQLMETGAPFQYLGSRVPFNHPMRDQAMKLTVKAVQLVPGMKGYVGVDLVLADDRVDLIEINPRITTSYIGLRRVARTNLAHAMWNACVQDVLPGIFPLEGEVVIRKDDPGSWDLQEV